MPTAAKIAASTSSGLVKFSTPPAKMPASKAESGGEQTGAQSADTGGKQNGRDEEEEGAVPVQQGPEPKPEQKQETDGRDSEPIMRRERSEETEVFVSISPIGRIRKVGSLKAPCAAQLCHVWDGKER